MSEENASTVSPEQAMEEEEEVDCTERKNEDGKVEDSTVKEELPVETLKKAARKMKKKAEPEEDEYDGDEEQKLGLLERPVLIESGKREKKKVERLEMSIMTPKEKKKLEIPEGVGEKLGECPRIEYQLQKLKTDDLKPLHRILFNRPGSTVEIKKNIRRFCGFNFDREDKEFEKKINSIRKHPNAALKRVCESLDLEKSGSKGEIVNRIMEFLMSPKSSGKQVRVPKKKKRSLDTKKVKVQKKKKDGAKKKDKELIESEDEEEDEDEENTQELQPQPDGEEENSEDNMKEVEESEEEVITKPKKKPKTEPAKRAPKKDDKKNDKKEVDKREVKKEKSKKEDNRKPATKKRKIADDDSSDDEPISKKKNPPTNEELHDVVKKILEGANLEEVTMKTVIKQVYAKYPDFDLTDKKDFIKNTVKQIIS